MNEEQLLKKIRENQNDISCLAEALKTANKRYAEAQAQLIEVRKIAEKRIAEAASLIDNLYARIEAMCDEWEVQVNSYFTGTVAEKENILKLIAPFRPTRLGAAEVNASTTKTHSDHTS